MVSKSNYLAVLATPDLLGEPQTVAAQRIKPKPRAQVNLPAKPTRGAPIDSTSLGILTDTTGTTLEMTVQKVLPQRWHFARLLTSPSVTSR